MKVYRIIYRGEKKVAVLQMDDQEYKQLYMARRFDARFRHYYRFSLFSREERDFITDYLEDQRLRMEARRPSFRLGVTA